LFDGICASSRAARGLAPARLWSSSKLPSEEQLVRTSLAMLRHLRPIRLLRLQFTLADSDRQIVDRARRRSLLFFESKT
jgi:hypothetical protein